MLLIMFENNINEKKIICGLGNDVDFGFDRGDFCNLLG